MCSTARHLWTPCLHACGVWDLQRAGSYSSLGERGGGQCGGSRVGRSGQGTAGGRKLLVGRGKKAKNRKGAGVKMERASAEAKK